MSGLSTPYIGSSISLISNAGIRYDGKLFSIDTKESTVTLAHVQSFGTEDRKVEKKVAARPDIYEYIVFRGKDIKDLTVNEGPKPEQDPAIIKSAAVGSTPSLPPYPSPYQSPGVFSPFGGLPYGNYPVGYQPPPQHFQDNRIPHMSPQVPTVMPPGSHLLPRNPTPPILGAGLSRNSTPSPDLRNQADVKTQETQTKTTTQHATQTTKRKPSSRKSSTDKPHEKENKNPEQPPPQEKSEEKPKQQRKPPGDNARSRGSNHRGRRTGYRGPRKDSQPKEFQDDYDFESANAKFKKEEIEEELQKKLGLVSLNDEVEEGEQNEAVQNPEPVTFYNKGSFFDSISCEAIDREKNRRSHPSWQEERQLNTETFGTAGYRRGRGGRGRGRGNYRGRGGGGGRGGYRGRGWRGGRGGRGSNRGGSNWVNYPLDADTSKLQQNLPSGGSPVSNNK
ncbi:hypothetical protein QZH41_010725 [Actinostola sp. cb2023]|nr:hypothetical protein QZH41_010725 [Actinostola sp. cb2023]